MEPIHFGPADRQLFGWLHLPAEGAPRRTAVVLCHPFGQEFVLAHRAFHGLARQLAAAGFAVLRFDYFGTGDSWGDFAQADPEAWKLDITAAMRTLQDRVDCDDVALVGMRLGGSLAALAGATFDLAALVLWDPVVDGCAFLRELQVAHWKDTHRTAPVPEHLPEPLEEASGFPVSERMRGGLRAIDLRSARLEPGLPVLVVDTSGSEAAAGPLQSLLHSWTNRGLPAEVRRFPGPAVWEENEQRVLVPHLALQQIVNWMQSAS